LSSGFSLPLLFRSVLFTMQVVAAVVSLAFLWDFFLVEARLYAMVAVLVDG